MKNLVIFIALLTLFSMPAQADEAAAGSCDFNKISRMSDMNSALDVPEVIPVYVKNDAPIQDELFTKYEQSDKAIKLWVRKKGAGLKNNIEDELVNKEYREKAKLSIKPAKKPKITDDFAPKTDIGGLAATKARNVYDFTKEQIPVKLKILKNLTTKNGIIEGSQILFKTDEDVVLNGVKLPKGTKIAGRIETLSETDKMGTPANIIIDNFYVKNRPEICFYGCISKTGANRSIWVYPLYQAGNLVLYVAGFVFVPIHGGHAKLSTNETYTVFYEAQ